MKKLVVLVLVCAMLMAGCTSRTQFGECIGVQEDEVPTLRYKLEAWNIVWAVIFVETIFVPLIVLFSEVKCPVGKVSPQSTK